MKDENLNLEFKGVWIPATIWLNKELSIQEKMLLVKIDSFKTCFASNQYLADFMGLSVPRVKSIIGNLRKLGFITSKEDRKGNITTKRTLYVDQVMFHGIAGIENNTTPVLDPIPPRIENDTHSNTVSNKDSNTVSCSPIQAQKVKKLTKAELLAKKVRDNSEDYPALNCIDDELLTEWAKLRTRKGASDSDRALSRIETTLETLRTYDQIAPDYAIGKQCDAGWTSIEVDYFVKPKLSTGQQLTTHQPQQTLSEISMRTL